MKTKILTLIALVALTITTTSATFANAKTTNGVTTLKEVSKITSIEAHGNVEVYITSGDKDGVKVYDSYYDQNALVQNADGVLRVASYKTDKLVIMVTVTDLRAISASDNAIIKSYGRLSSIDLGVELNNNATAQLNIDALAARFNVNDHAKADISGSIEDYELAYSRSSSVNRTYLVASNKSEKITTSIQPIPAVVADNANLASL